MKFRWVVRNLQDTCVQEGRWPKMRPGAAGPRDAAWANGHLGTEIFWGF